MNMVEKVARAICEAQGDDPDYLEPGDAHGIDAYFSDGEPAFRRWKNYIREARAAIEAMREPSNAILKAGYEAMFADEWTGRQAPMMGAGFDAMLSAALSEQPSNMEEE